MSADSYKLEAVHADKNYGARKKKKKVVRPYMGNASKRRSFMRLKRGSRDSDLACED